MKEYNVPVGELLNHLRSKKIRVFENLRDYFHWFVDARIGVAVDDWVVEFMKYYTDKNFWFEHKKLDDETVEIDGLYFHGLPFGRNY